MAVKSSDRLSANSGPDSDLHLRLRSTVTNLNVTHRLQWMLEDSGRAESTVVNLTVYSRRSGGRQRRTCGGST